MINSYPQYPLTTADKFAVFPLAQQAVGVCTIASNVCNVANAWLFSQNEEMERSLNYIHLGFLRLIPVVATEISLERCKPLLKADSAQWRITQVAQVLFAPLPGEKGVSLREAFWHLLPDMLVCLSTCL